MPYRPGWSILLGYLYLELQGMELRASPPRQVTDRSSAVILAKTGIGARPAKFHASLKILTG
ncbi:MAG: hypothetical protein WA118_11145 [Carboxydocellales bacterium]